METVKSSTTQTPEECGSKPVNLKEAASAPAEEHEDTVEVEEQAPKAKARIKELLGKTKTLAAEAEQLRKDLAAAKVAPAAAAKTGRGTQGTRQAES